MMYNFGWNVNNYNFGFLNIVSGNVYKICIFLLIYICSFKRDSFYCIFKNDKCIYDIWEKGYSC